jgi:AraC family transcriptional regulator
MAPLKRASAKSQKRKRYMHIARSLFQNQSFSLLCFEHPPQPDDCGDGEETCSAYAVNFVEAGSFELGVRNQRWELSRGAVFLSEPGVVHRYHHFSRTPFDVCLSARYSPTFVERGQETYPEIFEKASSTVPASNRLAFLKHRLSALLSAADHLAIETWASELFIAARTPPSSASRLYRPRQLAWYADHIVAARDRLAREYAEPHSLVSLARGVGMSPFHFARVFHELIGLPPHRYLIRCRLDHALEMLRAGQAVTAACFDSGFMNLSHFIRSFERRFGCRPSSVRRQKVVGFSKRRGLSPRVN